MSGSSSSISSVNYENVYKFLEDVAKNDTVDSSPIEGTNLSMCQCSSYPLDTRVKIAHEFVAAIKEDSELLKMIKKTKKFSCFFFGSGRLLQELMQISLLLEEKKPGGILERVNSFHIQLQDPIYEEDPSPLEDFSSIIFKLCKNHNISNVEIEVLSSDHLMHPKTHIISGIDVIDSYGIEESDACVAAIKKHSKGAQNPQARIFMSYSRVITDLTCSSRAGDLCRITRISNQIFTAYTGIKLHVQKMESEFMELSQYMKLSSSNSKAQPVEEWWQYIRGQNLEDVREITSLLLEGKARVAITTSNRSEKADPNSDTQTT